MLALVATAVAGLVTGSFLTTLVDRVPDDEPVLSPGPRCPYCQARLCASEVIPVVSWVRLRGRCSHCDHPITPAYPLVEIVTALVWVVLVARFETWRVLPLLAAAAGLIAVSTVDLYRFRIPNAILFPTIAVTIALMVVFVDVGPLGRALIGAAMYGGMLFIVWLAYPKGMGFGDVKLALLMGLMVGWVAPTALDTFRIVLYALILGCMMGVIGGLALAGARRVAGRDLMADPDYGTGEIATVMQTTFPFGPALAASVSLCVLYADRLV